MTSALPHLCWLLDICTSAWKPEITQINSALCPIGEVFNNSPQKMLLGVIHLCEWIHCKIIRTPTHPNRPPASSWWVFMWGAVACKKGVGGGRVLSNGPDVNNLNTLWKCTGMDMCCHWRKHYREVIENKPRQHPNPHGDRKGEGRKRMGGDMWQL